MIQGKKLIYQGVFFVFGLFRPNEDKENRGIRESKSRQDSALSNLKELSTQKQTDQRQNKGAICGKKAPFPVVKLKTRWNISMEATPIQ